MPSPGNISPEVIEFVQNQIATIYAEKQISWLDIIKIQGFFFGGYGLVTFFWMRHIKDEMRRMMKSFKSTTEQFISLKIDGVDDKIKVNETCTGTLKEQYHGHYEKYHSKEN